MTAGYPAQRGDEELLDSEVSGMLVDLASVKKGDQLRFALFRASNAKVAESVDPERAAQGEFDEDHFTVHAENGDPLTMVGSVRQDPEQVDLLFSRGIVGTGDSLRVQVKYNYKYGAPNSVWISKFRPKVKSTGGFDANYVDDSDERPDEVGKFEVDIKDGKITVTAQEGDISKEDILMAISESEQSAQTFMSGEIGDQEDGTGMILRRGPSY